MSVKKASELGKADVAYAFGCDERTISRYQDRSDDPLPIREHRKTKQGNVYDLRDVLNWALRDAAKQMGAADDGNVYNYDAERARLTKAQADKTEIEVTEIRGQVIRLPLVEQHWQQMVSSMRAKLLALPTKAAGMVAAPDKLQAVTDTIQGLVYEALAEIAGDAIPDEVRNRVAAQSRATDQSHREAAAKADAKPVGRRKTGAERGGQRGARKVSAK